MDDQMEAETLTATPDAPEDAGWEWAIVEVFGHRRHAGRIREEERFGAKMLRIDIPVMNGAGDTAESWTTHWYGGASLFSMTLTDEATVMKSNRRSRWDEPRRLIAADDHDDDPDLPF